MRMLNAGQRTVNQWHPAGVILLALSLLALGTPLLWAQAGLQGNWTTLPYLMPINPIHLALLNNGKVLIVAGSGNLPTETNFSAALWDPQAGTILTQGGLPWDMFCNGMVVLPDGRALINGGTLQYDPFHGQLRNSVYDPATGLFTDVQNMAHGRWYPTVTTLGDGRVMTFSGLSETGGTNSTVEIYTAGSGWSQEYAAGWTPPLYPRMHLMPNGNVFYSGSGTGSRIFNTSTRTWSGVVASTNYPNTRTYGTSVLLPLTPSNGYRPRVVIMGGGNPATATTELIDLSASPLQWQYGPSMSQPRIEMNATILPNGKVLAVGGSTNDEDAATASRNADLYDPNTNSFSPAGANAYPRLYHSGSLLLPDATVMLVGGNPARGTYESHIEIYSPAYLFNGDGSPAIRPTVSGLSSSTFTYGAPFQVQTPDAANITSVVLVRPGAPTHAFDMDQRLVGLSYTSGAGVLNVTAPPNSNIAPPGYYMLFVLNSAGVPSLARFVQLLTSVSHPPPTVATPASATPNPVTATTTNLSVLGADDGGEASLIYTWATTGTPPAAVTFSANGTNAAKNVVATFASAGSYSFQVTIKNQWNLTATSSVNVTVNQTLTRISVAPASATVATGATQQFTATAMDQFNVPLAPQPPFVWTVSGGGTISSAGLFTAGSTAGGPFAVTAASGGATGNASVTVTAPGVVAYVQGAGITSDTGANSIAQAFTTLNASGNLIVAAVSWGSNDLVTCSDSQGNGYAVATTQYDSINSQSMAICYAANVKGGANTVTATFSGAPGYRRLLIQEYRGIAPVNPVDVVAQNVADGTTASNAITSTSAVTTSSGDLIFGAVMDDSGVVSSITAGTGFTQRQSVNNQDMATEDFVQAVSGSVAAIQTFGSADRYLAQMVAFKPK